MKTFNKYAPLLGLLTLITTILGGVYYLGGILPRLENGILTPIEKVEINTHLEEAPSDVDSYKLFQKIDSVYNFALKQQEAGVDNKEHAIKSRADRDTLIQKNTFTIYQVKEQQVKQTKLMEEILKKIED